MAYSDLIKSFEERRLKIVRQRRRGWTLAKLGRHYGISRQRVKQILDSYNGKSRAGNER